MSLKRGDSREIIKKLQALLKANGYSEDIDPELPDTEELYEVEDLERMLHESSEGEK